MTKSKNKVKNPVASAMGAAAIGTAIAKAMIAKTKKKKKSTGSGSVEIAAKRISTVSAPLARGLKVARSRLAHSKFNVVGSSIACSMVLPSTGGAAFFRTAGSATSASNIFNVDVLGSSTTGNNFQSFPTTVYNIGTSFLRFRFRKLHAVWCPVLSANNNGSVILGCTAEVVTGSSTIQYANIASLQNSVTTPVWSPTRIDLLAAGSLRSDWLFLDSLNTTNQAVLRQETAGCFMANQSGVATPVADQLIGYIMFEYDIEFDGLGSESLFSAAKPSLQQESKEAEADTDQAHYVVPDHSTTGPSREESGPGVEVPQSSVGRWFLTSTPPTATPKPALSMNVRP